MTVAGGQVSGDTGRVPVAAGEQVTLVVTSDVADEIHVHGYDLTAAIAPSRPARALLRRHRPGGVRGGAARGRHGAAHPAGGMTLLAHGVGSRTDLPIPLGLALYGAGAAILISFAVLLLFWRTPRLGGTSSGRPLPGGVAAGRSTPPRSGGACRRWPSPSPRWSSPSALAGPPETERNLAPWALYVTFWVGLVPASLLLGPVWRVANPLRLLHRGLRVPCLPSAPGAARLPGSGCGRRSPRCSSSCGWSSSSPPGPSRRRSPSSCSATRRCTSRSRCGSARSGSPAATASRCTRR